MPGLCNCGAQVPEHVGSLVGVHASSVVMAWGLVAPQHEGSPFPDEGSNLRALHCKADSLPLDHEGSP